MKQHICLEQALVPFVPLTIRVDERGAAILTVYEDDNFDDIDAAFAIAYCPFCGQKLVEGE